jgi:hypothetical protein
LTPTLTTQLLWGLVVLLVMETITTTVLPELALHFWRLHPQAAVMALVVIQQPRLLPTLPGARVVLAAVEDLPELVALETRLLHPHHKGITEGPVAMLQTVVLVVAAVQAR